MLPEVVTDKAGASPVADSTPRSTASITGGTASEALIRAASSAETTEQTPPAVTKAAGDTTPTVGETTAPETTAVTTGQPPVADPAKSTATGEAPEARITAAVGNARTKQLQAIGEAIGLTDQSGRPRALSVDDVQDLKIGTGLLRDLRTNAERFAVELCERLGLKLAEPQKEDYAFPKGTLRSEDGRTAYSEEEVQQALSVLERKLTAQFEGKLTPFAEDREARDAANREAHAIRQSRIDAGAALTEARQLPHFKEHEEAIKERMLELRATDPQIANRIGAHAVLYKAYNDVLASKVFPTITSAAERSVREDNARKAAGSSLVHPAGSAGDAKKTEIRGVEGLAERMKGYAEGNIPLPAHIA